MTSGAEEWVLKGTAADTVITESSASSHDRMASVISVEAEDDDTGEPGSNRLSQIGMGEADRHFVDASHAWKPKIPVFRVLVHSPSKRTSTLSGAFTVYNVTSLFHPTPEETPEEGLPRSGTPPVSPTRITVQRRYSHFVILHTALTRRLPGIALPPLPEKQYAGRFSDDFVEARRGDLERYISRIIRHPVARYAEVVTFFLSCESETVCYSISFNVLVTDIQSKEWKRLIPSHLSLPPAGPSFYAHVFHPAFNLDLEDAEEAITKFSTHTRAVGKGVQGLRNIFGRVREARIGQFVEGSEYQ